MKRKKYTFPEGEDHSGSPDPLRSKANIDLACHLKPQEIDYFHPDFFSRQDETFLSSFVLAESGLIDLAHKVYFFSLHLKILLVQAGRA